jgi:hypothetical protein
VTDPDPRLVVPAEAAGALAALIRWAVPRVRVESGGAVPCERELLVLQHELADAARSPLPHEASETGPIRNSDGVVSVADAARAMRMSRRTLSWRCANGRVPGARIVGRSWHVPEEWLAIRLDDERSEGIAA